jgi:DNA-binding CsgD family transcriptional regulator
MELSPLAETDIGELARAALGGPVAPQTVRRLWSLSEGLPLLLRELVLGALAEGTFGVHDGRWHWRGPAPTNPRLAELIEARLGRLDAEEQRALELVALGEPLELPVLVALAGAPLAESLEQKALIRERRSGRRLDAVLAHPLYGEMVRAATPPLRRRRLYEELANAVSAHGWRRREDYLRVALWRLEAGVGEQPDRLLAAFRVARSANDEVLAERLARTALAAGGGARAAVALADVLQAGGRWDEAAAVIRSAWDEPVDGPVRAELAIRLAWTIGYGEGDLARGTAVIDEVEQQVTDADARDALENQRIGFLCDAGRVVAAVERCADLLDRPSLGVEHRADTQSMLAFGLAAMGRTVQAAELAQRCWEERERWRPAAAFVVWQLGKARTLAALYAGDLDAADAALDWQLAEHSDDHAFARRAVQWQRGYALRLRGRIATAANEATPEAGAEGFVGAFGLAEAAHSAALFGDLVRARSLRSRVTVQPAWSWCGRFSALAADAWIAAQAGLLTEAIRLGQQLAEDSRQAGMVGEEMFALHHLVRLNAAGVAVERLAEIATVHDGPLAAAIAAHARAVAAADASALLEAADRFERLGMMLFAAEAAAQAGRAWHTDRRSRPATAAAGRALRLAERCEGARTPALVGLNVPELSRREYEVARLAADGRSNKEIATHLYIVERTVENHLRSIFIKTGITRREHLGDLFS